MVAKRIDFHSRSMIHACTVLAYFHHTLCISCHFDVNPDVETVQGGAGGLEQTFVDSNRAVPQPVRVS